jgi:hypothetical protein
MEALAAPENLVALALGDVQVTPFQRAAPLPMGPTDAAAIERLPASSSPVAALVHAGSTAAPGVALAVADQLTEDIGTVRPRQSDFALDTAQRALLDALRRTAADGTRAQLLVLALLVDNERALHDQQRALVVEAYGTEAAQIVDDEHERVQRLPPGARQPLADVAMPALRRLPREVALAPGCAPRICWLSRTGASPCASSFQHPKAPARPRRELTGRGEVRLAAATGVRSGPGVVAGRRGPPAGTRRSML